MHWLFRLLLTGLLLLVSDFAYAQEKKLEPLNIGLSLLPDRAPFFVAHDTRLFEKHGLDGRLIYISGTNIALQALAGGDLGITTGAASAAVAANARGSDTVIIASSGFLAYKLLAHPSITSIDGLRGKTIGVSNFAASDYFVLRRLLPKLGLAPGKDVNLLAIGLANPLHKIPLIFQGRIDATLAGTQTFVLQFELQGQKLSVLADAVQYGVNEANAEVITTRQFLRNHRDLVKSFLRAFSEAIWVAKREKDIVFRSYRKHLKIPENFLEAHFKESVSDRLPDKPPYPTEESIRVAIENLITVSPELKSLKEMKPSDFMDVTPLREIEKEGFFARMSR